MTPTPEPHIRLASPDVGDAELEAIRRVFASGRLTSGAETRSFEEEFAARHEVQHGVAFANGTVALTAMLLAAEIGPGDEVIVPSFTFISSATSILHAGATPVFADIDPETFCVDPGDVARCATPATRAVIAVHYGGQPADLTELRAVTDDAGATLIEDAAEAHGASYQGRSVGGQGAMAMFSFTPTKNITTGEGGLVTTDDAELARRLRLLRNHGQTGRYEHAVLGYNWRLSEMQAAMGRVQLSKLDDILARKRSLAARLGKHLESLDGISPPVERSDRDHVFMLYTTTVDERRDLLLEGLVDEGIEARLYFPPAHRQPVFAHATAELPVTDWAADHALSLPLHARLADHEIDEIAERVAGCLDG